MKHPPSRNLLLSAFGATIALVAVALARGGGPSAPNKSSASSVPSAESFSAGAMIAKDPETNTLRPATVEEMAALRQTKAAAARSESRLLSQRLANGAVVTTLDSSYDVYSVAAKGADGKIRRACVPADRLEAAQNGEFATEEALDEK